jgi:putative membrane protein
MLLRALVLWVLLALAIGLTAAIVPGIEVDGGLGTLMVVAFVVSFLNVTIGTILRVVTIPLRVITLGLVGVLVNVAVLALSALWTDSLSIDGFFPALVAAVSITVISAGLQFIVVRLMGEGGDSTSASAT